MISLLVRYSGDSIISFLTFLDGSQVAGKRVIEGEVGPCLDVFGVVAVKSRDVEHGLLGAELDLDGARLEHVAVTELG